VGHPPVRFWDIKAGGRVGHPPVASRREREHAI